MFNYVVPVPPDSVPNVVPKYLPEDFELTGGGTTPIEVPELSGTIVEEGKLYKLTAYGVAKNLNDLNTGFGMWFKADDGADGLWSGMGLGQFADVLSNTITSNALYNGALEQGITTSSVAFLNTEFALTITTSFYCTTSGTLDLFFGSTSGTADVTLLAGASVFIEKYDPQ